MDEMCRFHIMSLTPYESSRARLPTLCAAQSLLLAGQRLGRGGSGIPQPLDSPPRICHNTCIIQRKRVIPMSQTAPVSTTPFSHPTTQHLLLNVAAIGAAVVLPTLFPVAMANGTLLGGVADAAGGLGQNLFSGFMQRFFQRRENDPTRPDLNRDLDIRLLGDAIIEEITKFANDPQVTLAATERSKCRTFAGKIAPAFDELMRTNELPDIKSPDFTQLLAAAAHEHDLSEQGQLTNAQLAELRTAKEQQADPKIAALLATLAQDNATLATQFRADFTQLNGELAVHFQRLSEQLQRIETKLDQRNDAVVDKLLARISEEAQEKGRLRAELEAALHRLAEAEAKGNISAGDTLTQLREDGDPKPLGAFLDQQLAATQTDLLALLRERLAVAYISGEIDRARECAHQILATLPNDLFATNELGHIYQLRGDLEAASKQ